MFCLWNAVTGIRYVHMYVRPFRNDLDRDAAFALHGVDGVADQVLDHPAEQCRVQRHFLIGVRRGQHFNGCVARQARTQVQYRCAQHVVELFRLQGRR